MKRILTWVILCSMLLLSLFCSAAYAQEEKENPEKAKLVSEISGEVKKSSFESRRTGWIYFDITAGFTNHSDQGIMEIQYTLVLYDKKGNELGEIMPSWNGQDTPLAPGETIETTISGQKDIDGKAHHASIQIRTVYTEEEKPPIHVPKAGEYLYQAVKWEQVNRIKEEPPVSYSLWIDVEGYRRIAKTSDPELVKALTEAFTNIRIREETEEFVTDNYNGFSVTFADGTTYSMSLNLYNWEYPIYGQYHMFRLDGLGAFWDLLAPLAVDETE